MNEHDTILIQELTSSYNRQLVWYKELRDFVQKVLSRLILSRGDISGLMVGLEKKQKLMEQIDTERRRTADSVKKWQDLKLQLAICDEIDELNDTLEKTSIAIKDFLDEEEKLKRYLEGIIKKETVS
jgi:hypothetical protein